MPRTLLVGRRVMICEDEAIIAMQLTKAVKFMGCAGVETYHSAPQAIDSAERTRPDLILMDIELPGMSGIEAVRKIREKLDACIIVVSGSGKHDARQAAIDAGATGFLHKPISTPEIIDAIMEFCGFFRQDETSPQIAV